MSSSAPSSSSSIVVEAPSFGGYLGTPGGIEGVGFWPRFAARLIDTFVHYCVGLVAGLFMGIFVVAFAVAAGRDSAPLIAKMGQVGLSSYLLALIGAVAYHTACESIHGSTLGKLMLSMVVVREDGAPCGLKAALVRSVAYFVDSLFFGLVGYLAMQKTPQQQRRGDEWAHTIVCRRTLVAKQNRRSGGRFILAFFIAIAIDGAVLATGLLLKLI